MSWWIALAVFAALHVVVDVWLVLVYRARKKAAGPPPIKGYLDLIPDLTDEQREEVRDIRTTFLPRVEAIRDGMKAGRLELADQLFAEPFDRDRVFRTAARIAMQQIELEHEVIGHILEEKELLTPPQKKRFHQIIVSQFSSGGLGVHDVRGK